METALRMDNNIKIFVCCHKPVKVPKHPLLLPIQVGAALSDAHFKGFLHDDTGENISLRNRSYCELTAQYWAWKNVKADYYGFFHYRRYLYPDINAKQPYIIKKEANTTLLDKLGYDRFAELVRQYDLIVPIGENMYVPVQKHYANAPFHHEKDLELVENIVKGYYPEMTNAIEEYLSGSICYFGNIYIMKRRIFNEYCNWLFPVLEDFDKRVDTSGYSAQEQRVDGYLAERLLGIYLSFYRPHLCALELPRLHFAYEGGVALRRRQLINILCPPGSRQRAFVKRVLCG